MAMSMLLIPPLFLHPILGSKLCRPNSLIVGSSVKEMAIPDPEQQEWTPSNTDLTKYPTQNVPPLVTALKESAKQNAATFHFPGHNRGLAAPSSLTQLIGHTPFLHDIPELPQLDNLFAPQHPLLQAQQQAAHLFRAHHTWFLVGGTTCGIQAAIMGTCNPGDTLIIPRNSHLSAISAIVLCGVVPKYIFPQYDHHWDIATSVEKAIQELELDGRRPAAVFITSPTYHGICSNLREISRACHLHGIPLIVDEAHGAHFGFHPELPMSALQQGADLAVQSTHKVLCSLTQSSMLHLSGKLVDRERICRCLQTLQSTSPSYLLLASLDAATAQLRENPSSLFHKPIHLATKAKNTITQLPGISVLNFPVFFEPPRIDPLRVTIGVSELGLSGFAADEILYNDHKIVSELVGSNSITYAFTPGTCEEHVARLLIGFRNLSSCFFQHNQSKKQGMKKTNYNPLTEIDMQLTPREAFFANKRKISIEKAVGKICGELICPYPPGIPVMIPGEVISQTALDNLLQSKANGAEISGASDPLLSSLVICDF
ncbi:hypothetical protein KSS87_019885 [Heliosperma pusillum]|nr:hypothetical protein KSS87_021940 [Heliosperma pusillum]KAH9624504.1 hypothetical protein KSS87_019885 [Heliosperma pusillum]